MQVGDWVTIIDKDLEGKIISLQGQIVRLEDEHGFTYDYPKNKVVLKNPSLYEGIKVEKKSKINLNLLKNIFLLNKP